MEISSSSLDVTIRTRKPYTITKQRERWTVEEHNRFLEALKLYGRSWQRIEEHIGTKTAVQIRSHAQKFFSKLEREASAKGLQTEDAHEIKIPPPRPKRKPNNPYPRKMVSSCPVSSILPGQIVLNIESTVKGCTETEASISKEYLLEARRPEILALFEENPCVFPSSQSNIDKPVGGTPPHSSLGAFREFMTPNYDAKDEPPMKLDINCNNVEIDLEIGSLFKSESSSVTIRSTSKICEENEVHESGKLGDPEFLQNGKAPSSQGYPRNVPVHVVDTSITKTSEIHSPFANCNDFRANKYFSNTAHHPLYTAFPMFHHSFNTFPTNPETFKSAAAYVSFTLSNFIISSLAQNPAAHTAATIATSFCPYTTGLDACPDDVGKPDKNGVAYVEPCADLAAVAAATVTAASAWWISQGLIPICHPQVNFPSVVTPSVSAVPVTGSTPYLNSNREEEKKAIDSREPELSQVIDGTCPAPESPPLLSAESDGSACGGLESSKVIVKSHEQRKHLASDFYEIGKTNARMKQYRSSCGSNTTSSSERETDNVSEDVKGASETLDLIHTFEELANRRSRNTRNNNDSWKEVSDEGRLAFQALFSRDVLPQSFSKTVEFQNVEHTKNSGEEATKQEPEKKETQEKEKTVLIGCTSKCIGTGFKPYKRCSVEANEIMIGQVIEKKALKRIRTEG